MRSCIWVRVALRASPDWVCCSAYSLSYAGLQYWLSDELPTASHLKIWSSAFGSGLPTQPHSSMSYLACPPPSGGRMRLPRAPLSKLAGETPIPSWPYHDFTNWATLG